MYWGEEYSADLRTQHEKTMYNPIYFKTDKFKLIDSGTKWLTSTPDIPSRIDYSNDTYKGLTYVVLEHRDSGERFIYVNVHLITQVEEGDLVTDYVVDTDGKTTTIQGQELQVIFLRAILDDLQNEYDLPMFISGDFNNKASVISGWFNNSYIDIENDMVSVEKGTANGITRYWEKIVAGTTVSSEKPEDSTEDFTMTFAGDMARYTTGRTYASCAKGGAFNKTASWNPIDLWFISNFDGIVHTYEIIDNKFEEPNEKGDNNRYPSDHLPAKLYVTLYID